MRPLVLLDVDGPSHPWAADHPPPGYAEFRFRLSWRRQQRVWLNPDHGRLLDGLGIELAWASSWGHRANTTIGPAIGLPTLPVVEFAGPHADHHAGWKYPAVARFAYGRPLAWLDDDFALRPEARDRFLQREPATLLVPVDPRLGVTETEVGLRFEERSRDVGGVRGGDGPVGAGHRAGPDAGRRPVGRGLGAREVPALR